MAATGPLFVSRFFFTKLRDYLIKPPTIQSFNQDAQDLCCPRCCCLCCGLRSVAIGPSPIGICHSSIAFLRTSNHLVWISFTCWWFRSCNCFQATSMQMSCQQNNVAKVAAASAALLVAGPAFAGDFDEGEKVFNANCAACHAGGQNSVVADHTLEKAAIEKVLVQSASYYVTKFKSVCTVPYRRIQGVIRRDSGHQRQGRHAGFRWPLDRRGHCQRRHLCHHQVRGGLGLNTKAFLIFMKWEIRLMTTGCTIIFFSLKTSYWISRKDIPVD